MIKKNIKEFYLILLYKMSTTYFCELCKKSFTQKNDYTRHINKKSPCISMSQIQELTHKKDNKIHSKKQLHSLFNYILDLLRDSETITGDKALKEIAKFLSLRLIEPQILNNEININDYNYDLSDFSDVISVQTHNKEKLILISRFSNISKEREEDIPLLMKYLWEYILSVHPKTKNIFVKGNNFSIKNQSTYKKIIDKLTTFQFEEIESDILGEAYEEIIQYIMTGKVLGQFFTPLKVRELMTIMINPQLKVDGTIETIFDPAMGTGGFLISCLKHITEQSKLKNIPINWDFVSNQGIGGREIELDTYQLSVSNMLISSGKMFNSLENGDSIRNPITNLYDIILANMPFGIDGLIYDEILHPLRNEYIPIKTNSSVPLFLQAIISILNMNGRCAVVLPNGKDLHSKSVELIAVREYLMKTCDLKEVIYLPPVFTKTTINTCIFYFYKKRNGCDVLKSQVKYSKVQKETDRIYNFSKIHQTTKVKFYDYNPETEIKTLLTEVPIEEISINNYSLDHFDYLKVKENIYGNTIAIKTLKQLCKFLPKSKRPASYGEKQGQYPFFKSSMKITSFINEADYNEESIIFGDGGEPNVNYGLHFSASDHCYILQNYDKNIVILKYIYYYLINNLEDLRKLYTGVAIKNISKENILNIKIPLPSLEKQNEVVDYCEENDRIIRQRELDNEETKKQSRLLIANIIQKQVEEEVEQEEEEQEEEEQEEEEQDEQEEEVEEVEEVEQKQEEEVKDEEQEEEEIKIKNKRKLKKCKKILIEEEKEEEK